MVCSDSGNGNRRAGDRFLRWLRLESLIMLAAFPVTGLLLEAFTEWQLTGTWVTLYVSGVLGVILIALKGTKG